MPLTRDVKKVVVGTGALFTSPGDTAMVADTVGLFEGWTAPWVHPGVSEEGVNFEFERDLEFHRVEEQSSPVMVTVNESTLSFTSQFAETTLENLKTAMGGGVLQVTAAGAGTIGKTRYTPSDELDVLAVGFEAKNHFGFYRRMYLPRSVAVGTVEMEHRRSESKRMFEAQFQSISDMASIQIVDKTANAA